MSFNWTQLIPQVGHDHDKVAVATFAATSLALVFVGLIARASLGKGEAAIVPSGKFSIKGLFELVTEFITNLSDQVIGHHGRHYVPMFIAVFSFIFINNLVGVIPGMSPATENINTTFAMGLFMFITYNILGIKENGLINHLKHFMGPVAMLAPLMFVIELISHMVRPLSLGLRLANVMMGDHAVVAVFLDLVPIGVPLPFYVLGMFVSFVQAFVFTLLSMVYVAFATAHDH
ncbi:F0F1 ATP synthase subunit A [Bdellovibrio sp. HCB337]|uniref:F0F1 ATP synthase subunit A n=1 Tax=Bdellovibrio sp. HCB337 TaxID=3394358 RepID=UPI0039A7393D